MNKVYLNYGISGLSVTWTTKNGYVIGMHGKVEKTGVNWMSISSDNPR